MTPKQAKKLREKIGSQPQVAALINERYTDISTKTIRNYEQGIYEIPRWYIYFLKKLLYLYPDRV